MIKLAFSAAIKTVFYNKAFGSERLLSGNFERHPKVKKLFLPASPELKMTVGDPPDPGSGGATGGGGGGGIGPVEDNSSPRQGGGGGGGGGGGACGDGSLYDLPDT